jgi:hypothetical protein
MMIGFISGLAAVVLLGVDLYLFSASSGSMVFSSYPGTFEFTGISRNSGTHYYALKWVRDPGDARPCPLVVHGDGGDVGAAELADPDRLLRMGWVVVPDPPLPPEWVAVAGADRSPGLPSVVKYAQGCLRITTLQTDGILTCVCVGLVEPGEELMASHVGTVRYAVSVGGQQITLPMSEVEMLAAFGPPDGRRKDY